jgi:hypothetical protein
MKEENGPHSTIKTIMEVKADAELLLSLLPLPQGLNLLVRWLA